MPVDLKKLNKEQKEAVLHNEGPLLIVAGAGTGKTTVITQRIVNLIEDKKAEPEEILAVTFTEKAASEMQERVEQLLDVGYVDLWISTFHAFCERVLRDHALDIGLSPNFKILDQTSAWLLARKNIDQFSLHYYRSLGNPTKFIQSLIYHFSHCKDQEIYPKDYLDYAEKLKTRDDSPEEQETERIKEVAEAYHVYQKMLLDNNCLDFGDLINYCLKLFKDRPLILKKFQEKFKYILVDEFQDTNWSQYELIKMLAAPKNNLCVCADDDQAIYRWRGASFSNIILFKKDFPKSKQIALIKNYRSCQNILDKSYAFIKQNDPDRLEFQAKIDKKLVAAPAFAGGCGEARGVIEHIHAKTLDEEVRLVVKKILEILKNDKKASFNDFVILVRANDSAVPFIKALERANLPYQFLASRGLYSKPIILDVISYFKLLDNYHESSAVYRILNLPFLEIDEQEIAKLTQYSHKRTRSLFEALQELPLIQGISPKTQEKINFVLSLVKKHSQMAREKGPSEIMVDFLHESGYLKFLAKDEDSDKLDLLNQFYKKVKAFEESAVDASLKNFMEELNLEMESGEEGKLQFDLGAGPEMIKVMTIHGAKGLEFKYVFLVNMVDKRFPSVERKDPIELPEDLIKDIKPKGDVHLQEERRICYVAMTRAKKELYFTSAVDYGGQREKKLSRFLIEMGFKDAKLEARSSKLENGVAATKEKAPIFEKKTKPEFLPQHFSYSQLAAFEKCPLQYKFNFILKIPIKGKAVFSFGKTMHNTLYEFLKQANENVAIKQSSLFPSSSSRGGPQADVAIQGESTSSAKSTNSGLPRSLRLARNDGLGSADLEKLYEKNWIDEWYESKKQKDEYRKLGKKIIKDFYENFEKEKPEVFKLGENLALELPFNLKLGEHTMFGVIDRIDKTKDGIEIIDYKTGNAKDKLDAEAKEQLLIYQIALLDLFKIKSVKLTYYYLEEGKKLSFLGTDAEIKNQKEKIISEIESIKNSEFEPTPGWQCQYCDFKDICDFAQR